MSALSARKARLASAADALVSGAVGSSNPPLRRGTEGAKDSPRSVNVIGPEAASSNAETGDSRRQEKQSKRLNTASTVSSASQTKKHRIEVRPISLGEDGDSSSSNGHSSTLRPEIADSSRNGESSIYASSKGATLPHCSSLPALTLNASKDGTSAEVICGLQREETLVFVGTLSLTVLMGGVQISGITLDQRHGETHVFAPKTSGLPVVQASSDVLELDGETAALLPEAVYGAILLLKDLQDTNVQDMSAACHLVRPDAFSVKPRSATSSWPLSTAQLVQEPTRGLFTTQIFPSWKSALAQIPTTQATYMVRGPKRSGKSTFCRLLLQRLQTTVTSRICYLETDLGQPEFGPSGVVALHVFGSSLLGSKYHSPLVLGPSWTCLREPVRAHFVGESSPRDDPRGYINALRDLLAEYRGKYAPEGAPLIVNTQGWIKGMGADLLFEIEQLARPDNIFVMLGEQQDDASFEEQLQTCVSLTTLESAPVSLTRDRAPNALESRALALTSYFYATSLPTSRLMASGGSHRDEHEAVSPWTMRWDFTQSLVAQIPFIVNISTGLSGGIYIPPSGAAIDPDLYLMALNASIVGLVLVDADSTNCYETNHASSWRKALRKGRPDPSTSVYLGLAIVRSIDVKAGELHLLTSLAGNSVKNAVEAFKARTGSHSPVLSLVKSSLDIPVWLSLDTDLLHANMPRSSATKEFGGLQLQRPDRDRATDIGSLAGVPLRAVPYLDFQGDEDASAMAETRSGDERATGANALSLSKRRIRRNLLRPSQHRAR